MSPRQAALLRWNKLSGWNVESVPLDWPRAPTEVVPVAGLEQLREALTDCVTHPMDSVENLKARIRARRLLDA